MRYGPRVLVLVLVAAIAFGAGWFLRPRGVTFAAFPEVGELTRVSKPCPSVGATLQDLQVFSEKAIRYSPGDSAALEALSFQRRGATAQLLVLANGELDDEVNAEAKTYALTWNSPSGWTVTDCSSAVRYQSGRP